MATMGFRRLAYGIAGLLAMIHASHGHYTFVRLAINDEWLPTMQYIRNKTGPYLELPRNDTNYYWRGWNAPTYAGTDRPESSRCGRDNMVWAAQTDVLKVRAGEDKLEFAMQRWEPVNWNANQFENCPDGYGTCDLDYGMTFNHHGPLMVHLSPVPQGKDVREYDGSSDWVKIFTVGVELREDDPAHWIMYNRGGLPPRFSFKIPATTPPGQYLMRMDAIYIGFQDVIAGNLITSEAQLYPSCAQIEVVAPDDTNSTYFPKGIRIPEDIVEGSPEMQLGSLEMYRQTTIDPGYYYPGGKLWDGEKMVQDRPDLTVKPAGGR